MRVIHLDGNRGRTGEGVLSASHLRSMEHTRNARNLNSEGQNIERSNIETLQEKDSSRRRIECRMFSCQSGKAVFHRDQRARLVLSNVTYCITGKFYHQYLPAKNDKQYTHASPQSGCIYPPSNHKFQSASFCQSTVMQKGWYDAERIAPGHHNLRDRKSIRCRSDVNKYLTVCGASMI